MCGQRATYADDLKKNLVASVPPASVPMAKPQAGCHQEECDRRKRLGKWTGDNATEMNTSHCTRTCMANVSTVERNLVVSKPPTSKPT